MRITIETVDNGWIVTAGCMQLVFSSPGLIVSEFEAWILNPVEAERKYIRKYPRELEERSEEVMGMESPRPPQNISGPHPELNRTYPIRQDPRR